MANLLVTIGAISVGNPHTTIQVDGQAQCEGTGTASTWIVELPFSLSADEVNKACIAAGVAAVVADGHTVGVTDIKRLFGGAVPNLS